MKRLGTFLFLAFLLACAENIRAESNEAFELLVGAFKNSGNNPKLFQTGKAEFEVTINNEGNKAVKESMEKALASQLKALEKRLASDPQALKRQSDQLRDRFAVMVKNNEKQQEYVSLLFSGTDNKYSQDHPENCKRRVDSRQLFTDNNGQVTENERHAIFKGVFSQKDSTVGVMLFSQNMVMINNYMQMHPHEFQTFGRILGFVTGPGTAQIFHAKLDRKTFTLPTDFSSFFEEEIKRLGLTCEVVNEVEYDGHAKAKVVVVKKDQNIVEQYHIDPSRGFICPYIQCGVPQTTGQGSSFECVSKDYSPVGKSNLYYPNEYTYTSENESIGKSVVVYKLVKGTLEFNQRVSDKEFSLDISEGTKVYDNRRTETIIKPTDSASDSTSSQTQSFSSTIYHAVTPGTLSLSTDYSNLSKLRWLVTESALKDYVPPQDRAYGLARWLPMSIGIGLILIVIYRVWKRR